MVLGLLSSGAGPRHRRGLDVTMIVATTALVVVGLITVSVATSGRITPTAPHVVRQMTAAGVGVALAVPLALIDHRRSVLLAPVLYAVTVALLGVVLAIGPQINGARAWLVVGALQFQPSELAKVALLMLLASLTQERREPALTAGGVAVIIGVAAPPMALILAQPDVGTFVVFVALLCVLLLVAGVRVAHLLVLAVGGLAALGLAWQLGLVEDHQVARLAVFLDADGGDPHGAGYNTVQAEIAVGSGGLTGAGLQAGQQTALGYVPEHHTDFVFTVVAERTGFVGATVLLGLYAVVLWRGLRIASTAPDMLGTLLAAGGVAVIGVQVVVAIGMTVGLVPVIGLPLPFVSYGGTSVVASLAMIGLMVGVHRAPR